MLSYSEIRDFDDRLARMETGINTLVGRDTEIAELKKKVADLVEQHVTDETAKAALQKDLEGVFDQSLQLKDESATLAVRK